MFPELSPSVMLPSITTSPDFDRALSNLIRMSDLGAFIQLHIQGIEKGYSLNIRELGIPDDFLIPGTVFPVLTAPLFPAEIRRQLQKLVYGVKAYFNAENSLATAFGPFLYRSHFQDWHNFLIAEREQITKTIKKLLSRRTYGRLFLDQFQQGYDLIRTAADITAPWEFTADLRLDEIKDLRRSLSSGRAALNELDSTDLQYPLKLMVVKTQHIPLKLSEYLHQIQIRSFFKSIHLDYLAHTDIESVDDIRALTERF
ncbi:MAG: hypothetical protein ABIA75_03130 [Candidatus Neomarinimicrobiota bacterium]